MRKVFLLIFCALLLLPTATARATPESAPPTGMEARLNLLRGDWLSPKEDGERMMQLDWRIAHDDNDYIFLDGRLKLHRDSSL